MGACWIFVKPLTFLLLCSVIVTANGTPTSLSGAGNLFRGKYIGRLAKREHKVSGEVYAVDARTIHIRGFNYDGAGPDAFFWTGFTEHPSPQGIIIPNERGTKEVLKAYTNQDITLTLPDGLTLRDVKWLAVWCRAFEVNFGDVAIPADLDYPQPHVLGSLAGQHDVSSGPIVVVDAQTILLPDFTYDGQAPDVHFWVGRGKPGTDGIRVPDETGGDAPLVKSDKKTMVLSLPGDLTIFDIDYFGVWCRLYYVDFGHVKVPKNLNVPPSLKMLGVTPQTKLNCEVLYDDLALEVRWAVAGESVVMQLVGKIDENDYMAFGLSGDDTRSEMVGGDVVVGWFEKATGRGHVVDYFLDSKSQCSGRRGTCPDSRLQAGSNNVRLLSAAVVNGFTMLTFQRPIKAHDELDKNILTNGSQPVIWAVGPINQRQEASYHKVWNKEDLFIEFGRTPKWNCPAPDDQATSQSITPTAFPTPPSVSGNLQNQQGGPSSNKQQQQHHTQTLVSPVQKEVVPYGAAPVKSSVQTSESSIKLDAWRVPPILCHEPEDRVFYAQMGPTGGKRGYSAITGQVGWGISWYINGLLVPEIYVVRGKTYTFVVEGGNDPEVPANFHPFYITDDSEGGYQHKTLAAKRNVQVFAGVGVDAKGEAIPTATGRLCRWAEGEHSADTFGSYGAYQRSLSLHCDDGHPGILHWTPDENTPDLVYYQCYTHRYLGWKIHVVDSCESGKEPSADSSENVPVRSSNLPDQEVGESIQEPASILNPNTNHIKRPTAEGNPIDSEEARVQSVVDASNGKSKLPEHKSSLDKSQLNEKQEAIIPLRTTVTAAPPVQVLLPAARPEQNTQFRRPLAPGTVQFTPNGYLHVPQGNVGIQRPAGLHAPPQYGQVQFPQEGHTILRNPESHHPFLQYAADHYSQRIMDTSGLIYEPRPGLDYFVGPTGRPTLPLAHSIRYDGVVPSAPIIYASTMAPPQIMTTSRHELGGGGKHSIENPTIQGSLIRLKQPTGSPITLTPENVKFVDYVAPNYRLGSEGAIRGGRPHSRHLPKREQLRNLGKETAEEIKMGLRSMGAEDLGDESNFEIIKINDTGSLPFGLPREIVEAVQNGSGTFRTPSVSVYTPKKDEKRHFQPNSARINYAASETVPVQVVYSDDPRLQGARPVATIPLNRNNHMSKKFKDDADLDVVHSVDTIAHEDMKILAKLQSINSEAFVKQRKPLAGQREKMQKSNNPGFDPHSVIPQSGGFQPVLSEYKEERTTTTDDKSQYEVSAASSAPTASHQTAESSEDEEQDDDELLKEMMDRVDEHEFRIPELTSLQPMFRPSPQDSFSKDSAISETSSPIQLIELPSNAKAASGPRNLMMTEVIQIPYGARYPFHRLQETAPFVRREYGALQQESHPRPQQKQQQQQQHHPQPQAHPSLFKLHDSGRKNEVSMVKDLSTAANEQTPYTTTSQQRYRSSSGISGISRPSSPGAPSPAPTLLTYDGRPVDVNNGGVSLRPSADFRTPSIQHRPQYGTYRGEFPPPVPEFIPENLPQLVPQRGSGSSNSQQQARRRIPSQPLLSNPKPELVTASASTRNAVRVLAPSQDTTSASRSSSSSSSHNKRVYSAPPKRNNSPLSSSARPTGLEIIPNEDVTMVLVKGSDEQVIQRELPNILQRLGGTQQESSTYEYDTDKELQNHQLPRRQQQLQLDEQEEMRRETHDATKLAHNDDHTEKSTQVKDPKPNRQQQNNTDLHILTDIWSIINQDEAARIQNRRHSAPSHIHPNSPSATRRETKIYYEPVLGRRHKRQLPTTTSDFASPLKSVKRRSPDHGGDHHHDDEHDHSHPTYEKNSGSFLSSQLSLIGAVLSCYYLFLN